MSISRPKDYTTVRKSLIRDAISLNVQYEKLKRWHDEEADQIKDARDLVFKVLLDKFKTDMSFLLVTKLNERIKRIRQMMELLPPAVRTIDSSPPIDPVDNDGYGDGSDYEAWLKTQPPDEIDPDASKPQPAPTKSLLTPPKSKTLDINTLPILEEDGSDEEA